MQTVKSAGMAKKRKPSVIWKTPCDKKISVYSFCVHLTVVVLYMKNRFKWKRKHAFCRPICKILPVIRRGGKLTLRYQVIGNAAVTRRPLLGNQ